MRIAWITPYPTQEMGEEIEWSIRKTTFHSCGWIVNLQQALVRIPGVELHLFVLNPGVMRTQCVQKDSSFIHVIKNGVPLLHKGWPETIPVDVMTNFAQDRFLLNREMKKVNPDIVHGHGTEAAFALAAVSMKYPSIISMQGIISEINKVNPTQRFRMVEKLERKALVKARYVSCRTAFDTGFVKSVNPGVHIFQIQEAMNPVYFQRRWGGCSRKRILFVGSMGKHKGLDYLLQAVAILAKDDPDISLRVVGGVPVQIEACSQRCAELGISAKVDFAGFLQAEAIAEHHLESKVFVIPSTNENSPNTLAEAMVSGMPCIASAVGGIPTMIDDEKTGLLFKPGDVVGLVQQLNRALNDDDLCLKLGASAANVARERHRPENVAEETLAAYRYILEKEAIPRV